MDLLVLAAAPIAEVLPALTLLPHRVTLARPDVGVLVESPTAAAIIVDARQDLAAARALCRLLDSTGMTSPVLAVLTEGGLTAVSHDWSLDDFLLSSAGPAEIEARLRVAVGGRQAGAGVGSPTRVGELTVDEESYTARLRGRPLDLTYKEFELLKFLAQHAGRVFSRGQLLQEVWGYDYFGGTRTVDVHIRRLRAKLGGEYEALIGTVRGVGYKFVSPPAGRAREDSLGAIGTVGAGPAGVDGDADPGPSPRAAALPAEPGDPAPSNYR
ncbi:MAG: winged helix-turn-helix domain-containing protein [Mycobacteriales bacterium]